MKHRSCCKFGFLMPLGIAAFLAVFTYAVYALWNGVLAEVLPVKAVTYWQALGLLVLSKILFGGFPHRGGHCCSFHERMMARHFGSATPEEREKMRDEMRSRFGDRWPGSRWCCGDEGGSDKTGGVTDTPKK